MKSKFFFLLLIVFSINMANSQNKINITIGDKTMSAILAENRATQELIEKLSQGSIIITMSNYGGFEKVGELPWSLPTSDSRITTKQGDIMLYAGNNIVIFYGSNTWSYTPLGVLETTDSTEISNFVGTGSSQVTLSLEATTDIEKIEISEKKGGKIFTLDGKEITKRPLDAGIYLINKKIRIIK